MKIPPISRSFFMYSGKNYAIINKNHKLANHDFIDFLDLKNEKIVVEITNLVDKVEKTQEDIDAYCEFMKGVILNTSGLN